jgi:hypothetical protein
MNRYEELNYRQLCVNRAASKAERAVKATVADELAAMLERNQADLRRLQKLKPAKAGRPYLASAMLAMRDAGSDLKRLREHIA